MGSNITTLRVMVQLLSGGHVLNHNHMDIHQEGLHLRMCHTLNPMAVTHSSPRREVAWAGIRGRVLRPILPIRVVVMTTTNRDLRHMKVSRQTTLLDQGTTTIMDHLSLQVMDSLRIRSLDLNRTMALDMAILGTVPQRQPSSTMVSHQQVHSRATLSSQTHMLGLLMVDLDNGNPEAVHHQREMVHTRHHLQHPMPHQLSNLLLMVSHTQQLDLMGMLNRGTHSRVGRRRQRMVRLLQQDQDILSKVAMHSTLQHSQHMVINRLKTMQTMVTREPLLTPTMEMRTHSQDMVLRLRAVSLDTLRHRQLVSLDMVRQDTHSHHLRIHQLMISLRRHQHRVAMLHPPPIPSLPLQRVCHHSLLLLGTVDSGLHECYVSNSIDSKT